MYIPAFALKQREIEILNHQLGRVVEIKTLSCPIKALLLEDKVFNEIAYFVEGYRENNQLNEDAQPSSRATVLRAVTLVFNLLLEANKIKDPDQRTVALAGISASIIGIMNIAPDYGLRLISIIKSKL